MQKKKRFSENSSRNARIKIDYKGKKPKVQFSYPNIKNYSEGSFTPIVFMVWGTVIIIFGSIILLISPFLKYGVYKTDPTVEYSPFMFFEDVCDAIITTSLLAGIPILISYFSNKYCKKYYPKLQKTLHIWTDTYFEITLNKNHLRKEEDKIYIEIPLFKNIFLEYVAKKDFEKYLSHFQIKEYNLKEIYAYNGQKNVNSSDIFWYARFYFNKEPKQGEINVRFA